MALNLNRLNSRQREAVLHRSGPLLILAGAGSGKTSTMAYRIAHLIAERHQPGSAILGLSFTRKAANELRERVRKLVSESAGRKATQGLTITTFHSLCARILRQNAELLGYQKDFTILDQHDQSDLVRQILRSIKLDDRKFDPDAILFEIGQAKNRFLKPEEAEEFFLSSGRLSSDYGIAAASVFGKYQDGLRALNAMDFDDLIFRSVELLENHSEVRDFYRLKLRHVLVDEYQDTNPAQFRLMMGLCAPENPNLCVVGDDDQSIYAWRGADSAHILKFPQQFPTAITITLDQNYRSTGTILDAANEVISKNTQRHPKSLWSERGLGEPLLMMIAEEDRAEAEIVAEEILKRARQADAGVVQALRPWKDFAVLYRSNPQSRLFEEALRMRQIPYKIVGSLSFLDRKEIKDTLAYWRLVANPKDDASARRILNWPARGIGKSTLEAVHTHAVAEGLSFIEALREAPKLAPRGAAGALQLVALIDELRRDLGSTPLEPAAISDWGRRSLARIGAKLALEEENEDALQAQRKWENIDELANSLGQLDCKELEETRREDAPAGVALEPLSSMGVLQEFLARMTLNGMDEEKDPEKEKERDQVTLLTLHGAKGLEFPVVFLVGMEDGLLPHRRSIEEGTDLSEERRLCYVGLTRAKDQLIMTRTRNRIRYGKSVPRTPSRFLADIPASLIVTEDKSHSPDLSSKQAVEEHENKVKDYLAGIRAQLLGGKPQLKRP